MGYQTYFNGLGYKTADPNLYIYIIKDFQRHTGLDADGVIGYKTKAKINFFNNLNYCPPVFKPVRPYMIYADEEIESLLYKGLVGLGSAFNYHSRLNDFDVLHNIGHAILESAAGTSAIADLKNNLYGWAAYDSSPMESANKFVSKERCIEKWSNWYGQAYLDPAGKYFRGNNEYCVNIVYATSPIAGINKSFIVKDLLRKLQNPEDPIMNGYITEDQYNDLDPGYKLTRNFILLETYSTEVVNGVEIKRQIKPQYIYLNRLIRVAENVQKIRDRLNLEFKNNLLIGHRNSSGEIYIIVSSWFRTNEFQHYLYTADPPLSTTDDSRHEKALAIDINRIKGLAVRQLHNFIKEKCNTEFTQFIEYDWGLHLGLSL